MQRRTMLFATLGLGITGARATANETYVQDVEYLLKQFEVQAEALLRLKKIDWQAVSQECRAAAALVTTDEEHLKLVMRLLGKLEDGHAGLVKSKVQPVDEAKGRRFTGPRVALLVMNDQVLVRAAHKDAVAAGIHAGQEVLRIDDTPALEWLTKKAQAMRDQGQGFSTAHMALYAASHWGLADYEGTEIRFEVKDAAGKTRVIKRRRVGGPNYAPVGPLFAPKELQMLGRQSFGRTAQGFGYIHLRDVPTTLPMQLQQMLASVGDTPGLILDMRANGGGGCDHAAVFTKFLAKGQQWRGYENSYDAGYTKPVVVIVDAGVRSAGETVAGMLKEDGRAYMIGESATAGTSSQKTEVTTPSGLFTLRFSVATNKGRFNDGRGIEGIGVPPHEIVLPRAEDLLEGRDTLIEHAERLLKNGFPKGVVAYDKQAA